MEPEQFLGSITDSYVLPHVTNPLRVGTSKCDSVIPINDFTSEDLTRYSEHEMNLRCNLAAVYRLIDLCGWSDAIFHSVTVRASDDLDHLLLNPFGLHYREVTASSLVKVDLEGKVVDPGTTRFTFNTAGFALYSAVHKARPDLRSCIHVHHPSVVAVSSMKCGLLPVSQEAAFIGDVSYHEHQGIAVNTTEEDTIAKDLGPTNKVLIVRNHGGIVVGETIEECWFNLRNLILACEIQVKLVPIGMDHIQIMSEDEKNQARTIITCSQSSIAGNQHCSKEFKMWDLEFEANMRMLDDMGYRTGYKFKHFPIKAEK